MDCTETIYIQGATSLNDRLSRLDAIILALELRVSLKNSNDSL